MAKFIFNFFIDVSARYTSNEIEEEIEAETLEEARKRLKERYSQNQEEILENHLNQLYDLLKRCRDERNKRVEREVLADIAKIHSLEGTKKIDITSNGNSINLNIVLDKE